MSADESVENLLQDLRGESSELDGQLLPLVYRELKSLARRQMSDQRVGHTLQTTALVHEAWMRLSRQEGLLENRMDPAFLQSNEGRGRFLALAATAMRHILIDHARKRGALRRGGGQVKIELDEDRDFIEDDADLLLTLHESVDRLQRIDPRLSRVVEMRFFAGMDNVQIAGALGISVRQTERCWQAARAWLRSDFEVA